MYPDQFLRIPVACPPAEEQQAILRFLSAQDRSSHAFIRNRRRVIEVLNERKQAIIDRAMTRGLDSDIRLKPSGLDWLGDVPESWQLRRLKYLVRNLHEQTAFLQDSEAYIALEHVQSWTGNIALASGEVTFDSQVKRFKPGDILFGKLRPYLAKVTRPQQGGVCVGEFLVLRPSDSSVLPEFLEQKLRSKQIIDLVNSSTFGAKMPRADWTFIGGVQIAYPATHEVQREILDRIAAETAALSSGIRKAEREIELAHEYRTRLIADVVTGKVDVQHLTVEVPEAVAEEPEPWEEDEEIHGQDAGELELVEEAADGDD